MPSIQLRLFKNIQMFVAVSGVDVVIDKEVTSGLTECEKMNGFKTAVMHLRVETLFIPIRVFHGH